MNLFEQNCNNNELSDKRYRPSDSVNWMNTTPCYGSHSAIHYENVRTASCHEKPRAMKKMIEERTPV